MIIDDIPSGVSSSAIGLEFSDNESVTEYLQKRGDTPNKGKITSMCGKVMEKMEKQLLLWTHDMMTKLKRRQHCCELKAKEICNHII